MTQRRLHPISAALSFIAFCALGDLPCSPCARNVARADDSGSSPLRLQLRLDVGAGAHDSSLPGVNGTRRVTAAWVPVGGFRLAALQAFGERVRFGAEVNYLSSTAFPVSHAIAPNTVEQSDARAQEFGAFARVAIALGGRALPLWLPISLGYTFDAFTTETPLTAAQAYMLSGPRAALGLELPAWAEWLSVSGRAELGTSLTATQGLRDAGVRTLGLTYAFQAEADVRIAGMLWLGVRYRQAHTDLPLSGSQRFHERHRFVLGCLALRSTR